MKVGNILYPFYMCIRVILTLDVKNNFFLHGALQSDLKMTYFIHFFCELNANDCKMQHGFSRNFSTDNLQTIKQPCLFCFDLRAADAVLQSCRHDASFKNTARKQKNILKVFRLSSLPNMIKYVILRSGCNVLPVLKSYF